MRAGDLAGAGGAAILLLPCMLMHAAAASGGGDVPVEVDLADKARSAAALERMGAPVAAAMVRAAVAHERRTMAGQPAPGRPGGRP